MDKEETLTDHAYQTMVNSLKGLPHYYSQILLDKMSKVTNEQIESVANIYLKRFLPENLAPGSSLCIVTNNKMLEDVHKGLCDMGYGTVVKMTCPQMVDAASRGNIMG